jgi:hypothetical protein
MACRFRRVSYASITQESNRQASVMASVNFLLNGPTESGWKLDPDFVHVVDLERTPYPVKVSIDNGVMTCQTATPESLRVQIPWALPGRNPAIFGTSTLPGNQTPYILLIELARGRLTELRNYFQEGPAGSARPLPPKFKEASDLFISALMARGDVDQAASLAARSLQASIELGEETIRQQVNNPFINEQISNKFSVDLTSLRLGEMTPPLKWAIANVRNCRISPLWAELMSVENQIHWQSWETPVRIATEAGMKIHAGPLIDFSNDFLPPWVYRYTDISQLSRVFSNYVHFVVSNLKEKVNVWHVVRRPAMRQVNVINEEQQIKITVAAIQAVSRANPNAEIVIDLTAPWAEWLANASFELGPLHLADTIARADLGLTGIGIELAMGYDFPGSHLRELIDISKLLDMYQLVNLPMHLTLAVPSRLNAHQTLNLNQFGADPRQWPNGCSRESQARLGMDLIKLAASRSQVQSIHWATLCDSNGAEFIDSGLFDAMHCPGPLLNELDSILDCHQSFDTAVIEKFN